MKWLNRIFQPKQKKSQSKPVMEVSPTQAEILVNMIEKTQETELSCDEVQKLLDQFTEMAIRGEDAASLLPIVHHHLELCPECREEYEALTRILQAKEIKNLV